MAKPKDFTDDLTALNTTVRGEVDTLLKLVREKQSKDKARAEAVVSEMAGASSRSETTTIAADSEVVTPASRKVRRSAARVTFTPELHETAILETVTTRLHRDTNELLTETALRQKLKKESPSTRQDIIEVALRDWFRKHGYRRQASTNE
jgi:hypothetical protein